MNNQIGPYLHVDGAVRRRGDYIVGIAAAYNAFGLIGPEHNGIFVLDDKNRCVVLDQDTRETSGYHGPSQAQWDRLRDVMTMDDEAFQTFIHNHPRSRL